MHENQRLVLDRFVTLHYFKSLILKKGIPYDKEFMDNHRHQIVGRKRSKGYNGGFVMNWNLDGKEDWIDWHPYGNMTMLVHSNFNRMLAREMNIEILDQNILWGDNFLPWRTDLIGSKAIRKQLALWFQLKESASDYYRKIFRQYRPFHMPQGESPITNIKYLEVALEIKNSWVNEVAQWMATGKGEVIEYFGKSQVFYDLFFR